MSDKPPHLLTEADRLLRAALPPEQASGIQLRIDKVVGFELFNTRPYHNYETWSDGYELLGPLAGTWNPWPDFLVAVLALGLTEGDAKGLWAVATGRRRGLLSVRREDLDDAINEWVDRRERVNAILAEQPPGENQRTRLAVLGYHTEGETDG